MISGWTARAETPTTIIMWLGSLMAVLIIIVWIGKNIYPHHLETQIINGDLEKLQYELSDACNSYLLNRTFNPRTETGEIIFNESLVCINAKQNFNCKKIICNTGVQARYDLSNLTYILIQKFPNGSIMINPIK